MLVPSSRTPRISLRLTPHSQDKDVRLLIIRCVAYTTVDERGVGIVTVNVYTVLVPMKYRVECLTHVHVFAKIKEHATRWRGGASRPAEHQGPLLALMPTEP